MSSDTLYVFGDQSLDLLPSIRELSRHCRHNQALKDFMRKATDQVQRAVARTPANLRPRLEPFDSPLQLAQAIDSSSCCTPIVSSLLVISQLGEFIQHISLNPRALDKSNPSPIILSTCIGSLSAAAIASSRNLTEILQIAPQVVTLAFHVSFEALKRSICLEDSSDSWATILREVSAADLRPIIDDFNQKLHEHSPQQVYISAVGESSVTVSGPPSATRRFFGKTSSLGEVKKFSLPIKAAFHAQHLLPIPHSNVFNGVDESQFNKQLQHTLISPSSGDVYCSTGLFDVLHIILDEILQEPINWASATRNLSKMLNPSATATIIGPFAGTTSISQWLHLDGGVQNQTPVRDNMFHKRDGSGAVAIIGMSIRLPGSETLEEFWEVLKQGRDLHQHIPPDRFDIETHFDPSGITKNATLTPYGVFIDRPGYFDPRFFNMSPREAFQTDPQQRLMLLTTYEALENAGYSPDRTPSTNRRRVASFIGQTGDDYREFNANQDIDAHFVTGNIRAFGPGRLNYHFGWEGPSLSIDTACSSSGVSIQLACSALLSRECDMAVSGGANLLTSPELFAGLSRGGFLSKTGGCKTFDRDADGYVRGEGCGVIVLKRLEDAVSDCDNVLAIISGSRTNHSAEAVSITHPHGKTQERLFQAVLDDAGVLPNQVNVAEIHGTGTQAGDTVEAGSVTKVLCQGRSSDEPLILSTVKPNIGHGEAASGVTSVIKAVMMLQKNAVPPHIGIKGGMNEKLPQFRTMNVQLRSTEVSLRAHSGSNSKRRILVNNFNATGGNTSLLIEDPPEMKLKGHDGRSHKVVTFSAKTSNALTRNINNTLNWLRLNSTIRVEDVAYTTTARRMHYPHRKAFSASSLNELIMVIETQTNTEPVQRSLKQPGVVFCFTGQGSQYISMASNLYHTHTAFREQIHEYVDICESYRYPSFLPVILGDRVGLECSVRIQLAIVAIELALGCLWKSWGIYPTAVVGHSLGEYPALCHAGVLSVVDCLYLVGKRAMLITDRCTAHTHVMLAVQTSFQILQEKVGDLHAFRAEYACCNSPKSTVISGPSEEIRRLEIELMQHGFSTKALQTQYAFHSSQLDEVLDDYTSVAENINFSKPQVPVASTMTGGIVTTDNVFNSTYLRQQTRRKVKFQEAIEALYSSSIATDSTVWLEVGPSSHCLGMIKATLPRVSTVVPSLSSHHSDWQILSSSIVSLYNVGLAIDWNEFHRPYEQGLRLVQLPNYSFDLKNYWMYDGHELRSGNRQNSSSSKVTAIDESHPFRPTDGLHRVKSRECSKESVKVMFATDLSASTLSEALRGHLVNGLALCSSSVYADMAYAAARYVQELSDSKGDTYLEINNMEVRKPLIVVEANTDQVVYVAATRHARANEIHVNFSSQCGPDVEEHASCIVRSSKGKDERSSWTNNISAVRKRICNLKQTALEGKTHRILKSMVYKLFKNFVDYGENYQGLEEVHLNTDMLEAAANVKLCSIKHTFACSPYWIDSITHLSGFVLNSTEFTPIESVFISHGWKSLKIFENLYPGMLYKSYVRMEPGIRRTILTGNVYLLDANDELVALCEDVKFQQIKRNVLDHILSSCKPMLGSTDRRKTRPSFSLSSTKHISGLRTRQSNVRTRAESKYIDKDFGKVLDVFAAELGTHISDLDQDADFGSLGIDNFMMTNILTALTAQFGAYIPTSVFTECRSLGELHSRLSTNSADPSEQLSQSQGMSAASSADPTSQQAGGLGCDIMFSRILNALADELGMEVSELGDDAMFADLGFDSLLTISMLSKLSKIVGEKVPASVFSDCPTVDDLRRYFKCLHVVNSLKSGEVANNDGPDSNKYDPIGAITPATEIGDHNDECCLATRSVTTEILRKVVAEEIGLSTTEIEDDVLLGDLGVDSLMSLSILSKVKEQTGINLATTFLGEHPNFSAIDYALLQMPTPNRTCKHSAEQPPLLAPHFESTNTPLPLCRHDAAKVVTGTANQKLPCASSVLLQGSCSRWEPCLFLIPDGSGSASSYVGLPYLHHAGAVYGLNSPFLGNPDSFELPLSELVKLYVIEMQRIQPVGPYHIGGWSVGGICAFEAAAQFIQIHGQKVSSLVLIDAPCPTVLPPLPIQDVDFLQCVGAFDTLQSRVMPHVGAPVTSRAIGLNDGIREHFAGSLNALETYTPAPIEASQSPESVLLVWARHGVWDTLGEDVKVLATGKFTMRQEHPTTEWLMNTRSSYETCGWEELLPGSNFTCQVVQGDHFSIMRKPNVLEMGAKIRSSFART